MDVELAHRIEGTTPIQKWLSVLVGLTGVVVALLLALDLAAMKRYEERLGRSARLSVDIFGRLAGSSFPVTAESRSTQAAIFRELQSLARQTASSVDPLTGPWQAAIAEADHAAAERLKRLADKLGEVPPADSGVDPLARSVLGTTLEDAGRLVGEQNRLLDEATRSGNQSSRFVFALTVAGLAAALLALAAVIGTRRGASFLVVSAGVFLLVSIGWGITAFFE